MLKKLFPFLFKKKTQEQTSSTSSPSAPKSRAKEGRSNGTRSNSGEATKYGLIARNKSHRGLRKGSKIYVRQIFDDDRVRVRGTAPNGKKVTLTVHRKALNKYEPELIPEHVEKHYKEDSMFAEEHEALVKAEMLGKR